MAQTATVTYDPDRPSVAELSRLGPRLRLPLRRPVGAPTTSATRWPTAERARRRGAGGHAPGTPAAAHEAMGHGGHDAGCRWTTWSATCATGSWSRRCCRSRSCCGRRSAARCSGSPCRRRSGCATTCSRCCCRLPVIFYSAWIFFDGAWRALRARTLDMMVLVAVAVGAGWLYSVGVTLTGGGEVFYEAATVLTAFVLLGHWFEMRARGGANDAIRTLLELAPPEAVVLRDGRAGRGPHRRGRRRRPAAGPARRQDPGRRRRRGRRVRGRRVDGHRREPAGAQGARRRRSSAPRSTPPARCGCGPPRSAPTPRWRRSSRWCRRRRTPRRPGSGWPTGPRSGWCSSR